MYQVFGSNDDWYKVLNDILLDNLQRGNGNREG